MESSGSNHLFAVTSISQGLQHDSVCDSVSVCPFAAVMVNKDLCTTASGPIQDDSTDSAISVTPTFDLVFDASMSSDNEQSDAN